MNLERLLILSAILFAIGLYGALTRRNAVAVLMALEIMFSAVNLAFIASSRYIVPSSLRVDSFIPSTETVQSLLTGQIFAIFIIAVSAAEIALGLAIIMVVYKNRDSIDVSELNSLNR
jgi:NADH:ubiquinone oxidoreductase subunit K